MTARTVLGDVFVPLGVLLFGVGAVGLIHLPDVRDRADAVAKAASLGLVSVLLGVVVLAPDPQAVVVLVVAISLHLSTVPIPRHEICRAAHRSGAPLVAGTRQQGTDADGSSPA